MLAATAQASIVTLVPGQSIQEAIDAASPGDIIQISPGVYNESINITKSLILRGVMGEDRPILNSGGHFSVVSILADNTGLEGLNLTGADNGTMSGIRVMSRNNIIANNGGLLLTYHVF